MVVISVSEIEIRSIYWLFVLWKDYVSKEFVFSFWFCFWVHLRFLDWTLTGFAILYLHTNEKCINWYKNLSLGPTEESSSLFNVKRGKMNPKLKFKICYISNFLLTVYVQYSEKLSLNFCLLLFFPRAFIQVRDPQWSAGPASDAPPGDPSPLAGKTSQSTRPTFCPTGNWKIWKPDHVNGIIHHAQFQMSAFLLFCRMCYELCMLGFRMCFGILTEQTLIHSVSLRFQSCVLSFS